MCIIPWTADVSCLLFTNTSCFFSKTRLVNQSCHHAVFRKLRGPFLWSPNHQLTKFVMCHNFPPNFTGLVGVPFLLANVPHLPFSQIARNRLQFEDLGGKILEKQRGCPSLYSEMEVGKLEIGGSTASIVQSATMLPCLILGHFPNGYDYPIYIHRFSPPRLWSIWHRSQSHQWQDLGFWWSDPLTETNTPPKV